MTSDNGESSVTVRPGPEVLHFDPATIRINPQSMRMLTKATGRTMEQLMQSDEPADKFQAMAFFELRRRHPDLDAGDLWELAGTVDIELGDTTVTADPFGTGSATAGPRSPTTGGSTPTSSTT